MATLTSYNCIVVVIVEQRLIPWATLVKQGTSKVGERNRLKRQNNGMISCLQTQTNGSHRVRYTQPYPRNSMPCFFDYPIDYSLFWKIPISKMLAPYYIKRKPFACHPILLPVHLDKAMHIVSHTVGPHAGTLH